jgi:ASC-1-like (ASCH) protein
LKDKKGEWESGRNELFEREVSLAAAFEKQMECFLRRVGDVGKDEEYCDESIVEKLLKLYSALYESARTQQWVIMQ